MTTYAWTFSVMEALPSYDSLQDVVVFVNWTLSADDGQGHVASLAGRFEVVFNPADPFIPYDQLTADVVTKWANEALDVPSREEQLNNMLAQLANPPIVTLAPPWGAEITVAQDYIPVPPPPPEPTPEPSAPELNPSTTDGTPSAT